MYSFNKRFIIVIVAVIIYLACIFIQTFRTVIIDGKEYRALVTTLKKDSVPIQQLRGFIFADKEELLAGSLPEYNIHLDFYYTTIKDENSNTMNIPSDTIDYYFGSESHPGPASIALSNFFGDRSAAQYSKIIRTAYKKRTKNLLLKRNISYNGYKKFRQLPFFNKAKYKCGLIREERAHRYRPYGENRMASCVIGDVYGNNGNGRSGIEQAYDSLLRGKPGLGYKQYIRKSLLEVTQIAPVDGANIYTTLNVEMQDILDRALNDEILKWKAVAGWGAVMEVETGKIKAISNLLRDGDRCFEDHNHLTEDLVDPGSTFKTVSMMTLLEDKKLTPETRVNTNNTDRAHPVSFNYHGQQIRDDHPVGEVTADEAICQSSNIAVAMLTTQAYESNPQAYLDGIERTGIFEELDIRHDFPKAQHPRKRRLKDAGWSRVSLGQISYGYETQIPGINILAFYNAIANGGKMMRPYIVDHVEKDGSILFEQEPEVVKRRICSSETLKAIRHMLEGVVEHGTAASTKATNTRPATTRVSTPRVKIAGKTGTAQRYDETTRSYAGSGHYASFAGYFPADNPKYTCFVVLWVKGMGHPGGGYLAGPVVRTFAEEVCAMDSHLEVNDIARDTCFSFAPLVKGGITEDILYSLDELDFDYTNMSKGKEFTYVEAHDVDGNSPEYELNGSNSKLGIVPNVKGMGAADALYLLENLGLRVGISGKGAVKSQSLPPGSQCRKGSYISITLEL